MVDVTKTYKQSKKNVENIIECAKELGLDLKPFEEQRAKFDKTYAEYSEGKA